ncbi:hypothetical protein ACOMHN_067123 [Nucella lapillus]
MGEKGLNYQFQIKQGIPQGGPALYYALAPRWKPLTSTARSHPSTTGAAPAATAGYVTALRPARCTCNRGWGGGGRGCSHRPFHCQP